MSFSDRQLCLSMTSICVFTDRFYIQTADGLKWKEVAAVVFGKEENYEENPESYIRRAGKLHNSAIIHMTRIINEQK